MTKRKAPDDLYTRIAEQAENEDELELRLFELRQAELAVKKEKLAALCSSVLEDPAKHIGKLKEIHEFCKDKDSTIRKLALLSEFAIFKDIIPGYRIRVTTEEERAKLSKEVKQLWESENALLNAYKSFLQYLESLIKGGRQNFVMLAVQSMCELLKTHPHFNFRSNIISTLVPLSDSQNDKISELCCNCFTSIFKNELNSELSQEIVAAIATMVKSKQFFVRSEVLDTFLVLPLTEEMYDIDIFSNESKKQKKKKKKKKDDKALEKELREAEAVQNKEEKKRLQTEMLKSIFLTYFRILKKATHSLLLPSVLKGLGRFSHLINVEVIADLFDALKDILSAKGLGLNNKLQCIATAFQIIKRHESMTVDLKDFYNDLYKCLPKLCISSNFYCTKALLHCLQLMFIERKQVQLDRVAAFVKRLGTVSLFVPPNATIAILAFIYNMMQKYPKLQQMLDPEEKGIGIYLPEISDPEHCNAFASTLTELTLLKTHPNPYVAAYASSVLQNQTINAFVASSILQLYELHEVPRNELFRPKLKAPRKHPLQQQQMKVKEGKALYLKSLWSLPPSKFAAMVQ